MPDRKWEGIIIHHTRSHDVPASEIDKWHKEMGYGGIGYSYIIRADGKVENGRPLDQVGAHCKRDGRNFTHIGIALTGWFSGVNPQGTHSEPTDEQIASCITLIKSLKNRFGFPLSNIERHHAQCPGERFPLEEIIKRISPPLQPKEEILAELQKIEERISAIRGVLNV